MANIKSSKKDAVKSEKRRIQTIQVKNSLKTYARSLREAVAANDTEKADLLFKSCQKHFSKAAGNNIIHKKTASRKIARLAILIHKAKNPTSGE